ncbi:MAG: ImmA/IrrE family metallo-endopeptidase [bacterium]|nr:ImmA/IrrE family metallo-endopeptidase [bacterium]
MDYSHFKAPYIGIGQIRELADQSRDKYWGSDIPIDIEKVLMKLKIKVIPTPDLKRLAGIDSFITSDWKSVYVDNEAYLEDHKYKRVRFSMAHELGHFLLHKKLYESLGIKSLEDYYNFCEKAPARQYGFLETQANNFAGCFLVPKPVLKEYKEKLLIKLRKQLAVHGIEDIDLTEYIIDPLAEQFSVSTEPIRIALQTL